MIASLWAENSSKRLQSSDIPTNSRNYQQRAYTWRNTLVSEKWRNGRQLLRHSVPLNKGTILVQKLTQQRHIQCVTKNSSKSFQQSAHSGLRAPPGRLQPVAVSSRLFTIWRTDIIRSRTENLSVLVSPPLVI